MGRNAKLRSSRHTETKRLEQRHQTQRHALINGVTVGARLNTESLVSALGGHEALPSDEIAAALIGRLTPAQFTQMLGATYAAMLSHSEADIDQSTKLAIFDLSSISKEALVLFLEYQGACALRPSGKHDWGRLRRAVVTLSQLPEFAEGLKAFGLGPGASGRGLDIFRLMNGSMIGSARQLQLHLEHDSLDSAELDAIYQFWLLCGDHVENAASLAAGHLLCDAGELVLHYRRAQRLKDAELCLSHRSADGLLHFHPEADVDALPVAAIRKLRRFVRTYKGPKMAGQISEHSAAARLCRLIGLQVRNGHGFLIPTPNA